MKSEPKTTGEYSVFTDALKKVLKVTHSELKTALDAEKRKPKSSARASRAKH